MTNIIKDNRLVSNHTFATRFLSFVESITVADACASDEKDAMVNTAKELLKYQCKTATDANEIAYLKRVGVYEEYTKPLLITEEGVEVREEDRNVLVFSCMKLPRTEEEPLLSRIGDPSRWRTNKNRVYFIDKENCERYIRMNSLRYSIQNLIDAKIKIIDGE